MSINAINISNRLEAAGLAKKAADAVASEIVDSNDDRNATKADLARLEAKFDTKTGVLETKVNIVIALNIALIIAYLADKFAG